MSKTDGIANQPPGKVFPWLKGTKLVALDDLTLAIPAAVLREDEQIGSVILGDDDMDIKLPTVPLTTPGALIFLRLKTGMTVRLAKSCQAMVVAEDNSPRRIRVIPAAKQSLGSQ
jgi:hypothetical protein